MIEQILNQAGDITPVEWLAVGTAVIYMVYAVKENPVCWIWGIISCGLWAYASFFYFGLYLDAILQLFYVGMGFAGIYRWRSGNQDGSAVIPTTRTTTREHILIWSAGLPATFIFGYFFDVYTPAAATYLDAFTTVFSILATILLVRKKLENWVYWILTDGLYVYLYASRGAWLFALQMAIYTGLAVYGYFSWKKQMSLRNYLE